MRIGIYKDTLANKRGADFAVLALADGLCERGYDTLVFEKKDFEARIKEHWDIMISTGTNELIDLYNHFKDNSTRSKCSTRPLLPFTTIQQFHTNPKSQFKWKRFKRNRLIKKALKTVDVIQVLSEDFVPQVAKYGPRVVVIGNWSNFSSNLNSQLTTPNSQLPIIIYPAAFGGKKNHKLLIKAFEKVSGEFPEWKLHLYGGGKPPKALPERVKVMGFCDLKEAYETCAFVAFPSLDEGFGLAILDAAMFTKPCLMVRDWIGTAKAGGGIVTKPTVNAYAEGLRRLMSDADLCRQMGENARRFCIEHYSRAKILSQWEDLASSC